MSHADPHECPSCGEPNACALARGESSCWCFGEAPPSVSREQVPEELRGVACLCWACMRDEWRPARARRTLQRLLGMLKR